jgi:4-hydroxy-L-threonine phosphate dehydrogenase PdxA
MTARIVPRIALPVGDPAGIGPELCLKAARSVPVTTICRPVIVGDPTVLELQARLCGIPWQVKLYEKAADVDWDYDGVAILARDQFSNARYEIGAIGAAHGRATLDSAATAIAAALAGHFQAVVAAPHTQTSIAAAGIAFDGYPGFLARAVGLPEEDVFLMLCFDNVRIAHCTLHVSVRRALDLITRARVSAVIRAVHETLTKIGIRAPKLLVAGVNPHAGENRLFGDEDADVILPAIEDARVKGIDVDGPVGADLMLHRQDIDACIVMMHDQGHIPAKLLARHGTAALSIGSPILFSSVAHGSALDIAGKGMADPSAIIEAIRRLAASNAAPTGAPL